MKALDLAEKFRAAFDADAAFNGITCLNGVSSDTIARPALIFAVKTEPMNGTCSALTFGLEISVESPGEKRAAADPDPRVTHAALVEAVRTKLHGTGKAALLGALNTAGTYSWRGWSAAESDPGIEENHFATPVAAMGTVLVL